ncbi:unnamed protein product [Blepharisma stoltei]|uniref:Uncharacterized protein n=1 Tax=Blepharisma stoltei TaxID=1481888 RepID=A0AAU9JU87_9CILI|nr:unnamed protein product [Blepharisma stoltei]
MKKKLGSMSFAPSGKEETRIFFPSALWLSAKQLCLAAVRVSILDSYSYAYVTFFDSDWNEVRNTDFVG